MSSSMDQAAGGECSQIETFMELFDLLSKDLTKSITKLENKIAALGTCQGGEARSNRNETRPVSNYSVTLFSFLAKNAK